MKEQQEPLYKANTERLFKFKTSNREDIEEGKLELQFARINTAFNPVLQ